MTRPPERGQPLHTFYGGAHLFASDSARKLGALALGSLNEYAPDAAALATAFELRPALAARIHPRIVDKLTRDPVEDFRIDFEDGFGNRSDEEEDRFARSAADEVAKAMVRARCRPASASGSRISGPNWRGEASGPSTCSWRACSNDREGHSRGTSW